MTAAPVVRLSDVLPEGRGRVPGDPIARVAVVVSLNFPDLTDHTAQLVVTFTRTALETLVDLGASFEIFDTSTALPDPQAVARFDGLLLLGGGDIDGRLYGLGGRAVPNSYGVDIRADRDAIDAFHAAVGADRPVFGVCRGSQLINVAYGGTIIPDIEEYAIHRGGPGEPMFLDEEILIEPDSRVAGLLQADRIVARSGHHQAVAELGAGLVVTARAHDGIVEGFEDPRRWVVGVQWHPEDAAGPEEDRVRLFRGFIDACALAKSRRDTM